MRDAHSAEIASIQVGKVRTEGDSAHADSMNRKWTTAFYKRPVAGAVAVYKLGLEGDQIADPRHHGGIDKAVLAYSADHYPRWRDELALEDFLQADESSVDLFGESPAAFSLAAFGPGAFAENLTIEGLDEATVCLGDRYLLGADANESVVVEVSQPREPCWKISRRWKHKTLTKLVGKTGRTGWYFRVLREGKVVAGEPVTLVSRVHEQWTVARANDVLMGREADRFAVAELMGMPELSAAWKKSLS
jgi:MOSC domain-containing protein YiiM